MKRILFPMIAVFAMGGLIAISAQDNGTTVFDHDPTTRGARDYANATDELLRRIEKGVDLPGPPETSGDATDVPEPSELKVSS